MPLSYDIVHALCFIWRHLSTYCHVSFKTYQPDPEDFCEEQWLMAKLIHLLKADVVDQQYVVSVVGIHGTHIIVMCMHTTRQTHASHTH